MTLRAFDKPPLLRQCAVSLQICLHPWATVRANIACRQIQPVHSPQLSASKEQQQLRYSKA